MQATTAAEPNASPVTNSRRFGRLLIGIGVVALLVWPVWELGRFLFSGNVHEVIPGIIYRGAQPSGRSLQALIEQYKIRTVLNVRGCCWPDQWYTDEAEVCERLGVNLEDVSFSAIHLPSRDELRILIDVLDRAERPIFMHCRHGADRTGVAAMATQLLLDESSYDLARRQLSLRYGHMPIGKTTVLDRFVQLYSDWLARTEQIHSPAAFRRWAVDEYRGGWCDARFEEVERIAGRTRIGETLQYRVVVKNTGPTAWQFRPTKTAGHHVTFKVVDDKHCFIHEGRAGMFDKRVEPGEKIEVVLIVPPLRATGHYRLMLDLIEEGHCWFHQTGSELWEEELVIRE